MSTAVLFDCNLRHERLEPRHHKFGYGLFMLYIDLDELGELSRLWPMSVNRPNLFSFFESDHLKQNLQSRPPDRPQDRLPAGQTLAFRIREMARREGIAQPIASVKLLTLPRIFNYVFNPVSFYFLFGENKRAIACVVEVSNTFKEMKTYLIKAPESVSSDLKSEVQEEEIQKFSLTTVKHFYVSPFGELADSFQFVVPVPGERLAIVINTVRPDAGQKQGELKKIMCANLSGKARPLTAWALVLNLVRYPLLTFKIMAMIHWHALLLFLKKVPFHAKEEAPDLQLNVFNKRKEKANG